MTIKEKFSLSFYLRVSRDLLLMRSILKEISRISRITTLTRNKSVQISSSVIAILNRIQFICCSATDTVYRISPKDYHEYHIETETEAFESSFYTFARI